MDGSSLFIQEQTLTADRGHKLETTVMRKYLISFAMILAVASASAQVTVQEPEFINSYCILTSDSTYATLPKESGTVGKHQTKSANGRRSWAGHHSSQEPQESSEWPHQDP